MEEGPQQSWLFMSKNFMTGLRQTNQTSIKKATRRALVISVSLYLRPQSPGPPLDLYELENLIGRRVVSFDWVVMYVGLYRPHFPVQYEVINRLPPENVILVISPGILLKPGLKDHILKVVGLSRAQTIDAPSEDESGIETMRRLQDEVLATGKISA